MSKAQLVITAVVVEGRSKSEVARDYDVSRYWVQQLCRRYATEGPAAFEPRSRRPHHNPNVVDHHVEDTIVRLRKSLAKQGYDAGADTIHTHLLGDPTLTKVPAVTTIWRILTRRGFITPQPHKRPRSAWKRFTAEQPNQLWQADVTHWHLADGTSVEILNILDDHSRVACPPGCREALLLECLLGVRVPLAMVVEGFGPVRCQVLAVAIGSLTVVESDPFSRGQRKFGGTRIERLMVDEFRLVAAVHRFSQSILPNGRTLPTRRGGSVCAKWPARPNRASTAGRCLLNPRSARHQTHPSLWPRCSTVATYRTVPPK